MKNLEDFKEEEQMRLRSITYDKWIYQGGERIRCRKASIPDVPAIAALYREIAVTEENCREKFNKESSSSFEKTGGMFLVMQEEEISMEMKNQDSFWAVLEDYEGIGGVFWYSARNDLLRNEEEILLPEDFDRRKLVYPREVIVSSRWKGRKAAQLFYATILKEMMGQGYEYSLCDVYRVTAFQIPDSDRIGEVIKTSLLNYPSYMSLLGIGAYPLGAGQVKEISLPGYRVWIEPRLFWIEHARTQLISSSIFRKYGIAVREG